MSRRAVAALAAVFVLAAGLGVHAFAPDTAASDVAGDLLYTVLLYVALVAIFPRWQPRIVGAIVLVWCIGVELFQLTGLPVAWADTFPPVLLVLGTVFDPRDLAVYVVAAVGAVIVDTAARAR